MDALPASEQLQDWGWKPFGKKSVGRGQVERWACFAVDALAPALAAHYKGSDDVGAGSAAGPADGGEGTGAAAGGGSLAPVHSRVVLPPLELMQLNEHMHQRDWFAGPIKTGGYFSLADLACFAVLRIYAPAMVADAAVLEQLPHVVRLFRAVKELPAFQSLPDEWKRDADLGDPPLAKGQRRDQEKYLIKTVDNTATRAATAGINPTDVLARIAAAGCAPLFETPDLAAAGLAAGAAWASLHAQLDPKAGDLPSHKVERKRQQIDNLRALVNMVVKDGDIIVEFGAGGGHVGLVLAAVFPKSSVILLDRKRHSLARAQRRAAEMGLANVSTFYGDVCEFDLPFNVGVALHFCGFLTDLAQQKCVEAGAAYVLCPCCYGKIGMETVVADSATASSGAGEDGVSGGAGAGAGVGSGGGTSNVEDSGGDGGGGVADGTAASTSTTAPASAPPARTTAPPKLASGGIWQGKESVQPSRLVSLPKSKGLAKIGITEFEVIALTQHCDYGPSTMHSLPADESELYVCCNLPFKNAWALLNPLAPPAFPAWRRAGGGWSSVSTASSVLSGLLRSTFLMLC